MFVIVQYDRLGFNLNKKKCDSLEKIYQSFIFLAHSYLVKAFVLQTNCEFCHLMQQMNTESKMFTIFLSMYFFFSLL